MKKKFFIASLLLSSPLLLTSCERAKATDEISVSISDAIANAIPNLWVSLAQLAAFGVTVFVFIKFAYQPIRKKLQARQEYVETNIREAKQANIEAKKNQDIAESNVKASRIKANEIIDAANKEAMISADKIHQEALLDAQHQKELARQDIENEKAQLKRDAHNAIVETALDASKEILGHELTKEDNDRIIDDFIARKEKEEK